MYITTVPDSEWFWVWIGSGAADTLCHIPQQQRRGQEGCSRRRVPRDGEAEWETPSAETSTSRTSLDQPHCVCLCSDATFNTMM